MTTLGTEQPIPTTRPLPASIDQILIGKQNQIKPDSAVAFRELSAGDLFLGLYHKFTYGKIGYAMTRDDRIDRVCEAWSQGNPEMSDRLLDTFLSHQPTFTEKFDIPDRRFNPPFIFDREAWTAMTTHAIPLETLLRRVDNFSDANDPDFRARGGIIHVINEKLVQCMNGRRFRDITPDKINRLDAVDTASKLLRIGKRGESAGDVIDITCLLLIGHRVPQVQADLSAAIELDRQYQLLKQGG